MTEEKFLLLKRHVCSDGLSDQVVQEIADECELVKCEAGEYLHHAKQKFDSVFLLSHGGVRQSLVDFRGNVIVQRHQTAGAQFGALSAALGEQSQIDLVVEEPTTLLRLDYQKALELTNNTMFFSRISR